MKRSESREQAFIILFEMAFHDDKTVYELITAATENRDLEIDSFARNLAEKTGEMRIFLDDIINKYSLKWKVERISKVAASILRMALCEMMYIEGVPVGATINEAVELAKKYGGDEDASFINGILGAIARDREGKNN